MTLKAYLLSSPERLVRSAVGLGAGVARELGEVVLPESIRRGPLYQNLVDATLRYLIEQVGGVTGVYSVERTLPDNPVSCWTDCHGMWRPIVVETPDGKAHGVEDWPGKAMKLTKLPPAPWLVVPLEREVPQWRPLAEGPGHAV